jgi:hypothetical protein
MTQDHDELATLRELNQRFIHNFVTNDVAGHARLLHPEFVEIGSSGARQDRNAYLLEWATGFDPKVITYWDMRGEDIAVYGDVALVRASTKWIRNGVTGMTCYTDTYLRLGSRWLCVQAQLTPVAEKNYPPDSSIVCEYRDGVRVDRPSDGPVDH